MFFKSESAVNAVVESDIYEYTLQVSYVKDMGGKVKKNQLPLHNVSTEC